MTVKNFFTMDKCFTSFAVFLICLLEHAVSVIDDESFFSHILEEPLDQALCDQMQMKFAAKDSSTFLDSVPKLQGKWVSQDCEVRPGPEFLLRSYFFSKNNTFRLLLHFYEDESCIFPLYTVMVKGKLILKEPSWVTPSATRSEYTLFRVNIVPHTLEAAEKLSKEMKHKCLDLKSKTIKPHHDYVIYKGKELHDFSSAHEIHRKYSRFGQKKVHKEIDCLPAFGLEFNELLLIRTQWRPLDDNNRNKELLLGDIHSRKEARFSYKPTAFQVPLLKTDQAHDCINCAIVSKGTERAPPLLLAKPYLPPLPNGQWISQRCEVRPMGMFLRRRLSFDSRDRTWMGEYKFYPDPFCKESAFVISASGKYFIEPGKQVQKKILKGSTGSNFDFRIENASLTLYDPTLKDAFNAETRCGIGPWYVGIAKELLPTGGCYILGIALPTTERELIKLEIDHKGTPLLLMGWPDTENKERNHSSRPTSYQAPLAQCSVFPHQHPLNNELIPIFYARAAESLSASCNPKFGCTLNVFLLTLFCFVMTTNF